MEEIHMRELRDKNPATYRLITIRTVESRLWLTPIKKIARLIGGILARYQEKLSIEIFAYCFLANHFHLLIRSPFGNTDEFCENINREISRRLNWHHHREGHLWGRRYVDQQIITEDDLIEAFLYVNTNATRHGLVEDPSQWGGLNSAEQVLSERERRFSFRLYSEGKDEVHALKLSVLPPFKDMGKEERTAHIKALIDERVNRIKAERKEAGLGFLGMERVREQEPGEKPQNSSKKPRAPFFSKCAQVIRQMREIIRAKREAYDLASFDYRSGKSDTIFPEFTFKPPLHRVPRLIPFSPLIFQS